MSLLILVGGCGAAAPLQSVRDSTAVAPLVGDAPRPIARTIQPGDRIGITWSSEERAWVETRHRTVDQSGRISMPGLAEVIAAGRTTQELAGDLKRAFSSSDAADRKYEVIFEYGPTSVPLPADESHFQLSDRNERRSRSTRKIQPGDRVCVWISSVPLASSIRKTVGPEGKMSIPFLGRVQAAGKNPAEFADHIEGSFERSSADVFGAKFIVVVENED